VADLAMQETINVALVITETNTQKKPGMRENREGSTKSCTFHGLLNAHPRETTNSAQPPYIQKQCSAGSPIGVLHPVFDHERLLDAPSGEGGRQPLVSLLTPVPAYRQTSGTTISAVHYLWLDNICSCSLSHLI